jgi:hypothetical protein
LDILRLSFPKVFQFSFKIGNMLDFFISILLILCKLLIDRNQLLILDKLFLMKSLYFSLIKVSFGSIVVEFLLKGLVVLNDDRGMDHLRWFLFFD